MSNYNNLAINDSLVFTIQTHSPSFGGVAVADSNPLYRIYENETTTPIVTGQMTALDTGNTVGYYSESIDLTSVLGFEVNKNYNIRILATVESITRAETRHFKITDIRQILAATSGNVTSISNEVNVMTNQIDNIESAVNDIDTRTFNMNDYLIDASGLINTIDTDMLKLGTQYDWTTDNGTVQTTIS